ncbi:MAG: ATP-binding protein [Candidatus Thorarchaeota archaeon]|nr:ATP-binding protein [Candidatus Thorarchaeota archaeon]
MTEYDRLGTVVCDDKTPSVMQFDFVVEGDSTEVIARRGQFVGVATSGGLVIARVQDMIRVNRYYQHAEAVREYQSRGEPLRTIFPTDRWQYTIAHARVVGFWVDGHTRRPYFAVSPGAVVRRVDSDTLANFLKMDMKDGLRLGTLGHHELEFRPNISRLLSKHLAILAMSGAGKSYFVSVMLEELLSRTKEQGRIAVIVIDVHGEYSYLEDITGKDLGLPHDVDVERIRGAHFQIPVQSLTAEAIGAFLSDMSSVQLRDLRRIISQARAARKQGYSLGDLMDLVRDDENINKNTRDALVSWLVSLEDTGLFGKEAAPNVHDIVRPGKLSLIDLSDFISLKKKQIVVSYLANELLYLRRRGSIPPFLLVLEEAHQFCPESRQELALPKPRIETIAREGRKFHALLCLISQRPVRLSTTVLSQCSNQAILRTTNPYDLDHIGRSSEGIDRAALDAITTLEVGEALFVGEVVSVPAFVKIRQRKFEPSGHGSDLTEALRRADR